ncbi:MAG: hypothetical protein WCO44_11445 [Bacteroidota bacterium]
MKYRLIRVILLVFSVLCLIPLELYCQVLNLDKTVKTDTIMLDENSTGWNIYLNQNPIVVSYQVKTCSEPVNGVFNTWVLLKIENTSEYKVHLHWVNRLLDASNKDPMEKSEMEAFQSIDLLGKSTLEGNCSTGDLRFYLRSSNHVKPFQYVKFILDKMLIQKIY